MCHFGLLQVDVMSHRTLFLENLPDDLRDEVAALPELEERLAGFVAAGQEAWPALRVDPELFVVELAGRLHQRPPKRGAAQWFEHVRPDDFTLALGCAEGDAAAIEAFERHFRADLDKLISRYEGPRLLGDDLLQSLREKLFVDTDVRPAKIRDYSGQGFLQNWLRGTGARTCIDLLRSASRRDREQNQDDQRLMEIPDVGPDLELDFLKREYREQFKEAFAAATQDLSSRQRNLLRQHFVFQLTMEQMGKLYNVHPSTVSRRVTKAREALLSATRERLMESLKVNRDEFDSIMRMIRSRIDLSLTRLLQTNAR